MKTIKTVLPKATIIFVILTVICGIVYPLLITGITQLCFPNKVNGNIIEVDGKKYGSVLLAQEFTGEEYLWGRVMNVVTFNDGDMMYSMPSNLSPESEEYNTLIKERTEKIKSFHPEKGDTPIPIDLITCSGSGLDPHISPEAAEYQIERISKKRGLTPLKVKEIVLQYTQGRFLGVFGEPTVNVLEVNLALDGILQ